MNRRMVLMTVALVGIAAGLLLGFLPAGQDCGSSFAPDYASAKLADALGPATDQEATCRDTISSRKPIAYGALALGIMAGIVAIAVPGSVRPTKEREDSRFRSL